MSKLRLPLLAFGLLLVALVSLSLGKYRVGVAESAGFLLRRCLGMSIADPERQALLDNILLQIRLPRILAAALIGASLSTVGTALQAVFTNPLVSPKTMGMLAGASFGAVLGVLIADQWIVGQALALVFGFAAVGLAVAIARLSRDNSILMLVLGGIASDALFMALSMTVQFLADPYTKLPTIVHWLMGNLAMANRSLVLMAAIPIIAGTLLLSLCGQQDDIVRADDHAGGVGDDKSHPPDHASATQQDGQGGKHRG